MAKSSIFKSPRGAFSLLEMSIVLAIIAVILGGGAIIFSASIEKRQEEETRQKLATLKKALLDYRRTFNHLPCPADITQDNNATSNNYFGIEAQHSGDDLTNPDCTGGTPSANYMYNPGGETIAAGMVPTKSLQLDDDYAFDGWGRRIFYAVDGRLTVTDAFVSVGVTGGGKGGGGGGETRIAIRDASGSNKTDMAVYALISFGPNGHGAFSRLGNTRITTGVMNTDELQNCHCDSSGNDAAFDQTFVQRVAWRDPANADRTNDFDDIVEFAIRAELRAYNE